MGELAADIDPVASDCNRQHLAGNADIERCPLAKGIPPMKSGVPPGDVVDLKIACALKVATDVDILTADGKDLYLATYPRRSQPHIPVLGIILRLKRAEGEKKNEHYRHELPEYM
jgi:hypothetical protein